AGPPGERALADVVQRCAVAGLGKLLAGDAEALAGRLDELSDAVVVLTEVRVALGERAHQYVAALASSGRAPRVLLGVHRLVGLAQRLGDIASVLRDHHGPERSRDREPFAVLAESP